MRSTVYIIENDIDISDALSVILESEGHVCKVFESALDFLTVKNNIPVPHFIFSDYYMTGMSGAELRKNLLEDKKLRHVPFILMTARRLSIEDLKEIPHSHYLAKPFCIDDFLAILNQRDPLS